MLKENMHQLVEVLHRKLDRHPMKNTQFSFFQMVYVVSGTGLLNMNGNRANYKAGTFIFMTPGDYHHFKTTTPTELVLIRFSNSYVKTYRWDKMDCLEYLLYHAPSLSGCIMKSDSDMKLVRNIMDVLLQEHQQKDLYNEDLTLHFVNALIVIAARNLSKFMPLHVQASADQRTLEIIQYIQENIYHPQRIRAAVIASRFGFSTTYLSSYFKHQCGESLQLFINKHKIRLIEHRLKFSDMQINEIVNEFNFSDESHLNKFFKKHHGISLTQYRKDKKMKVVAQLLQQN